MNQQALELILSQNLSTTKEFVKMMFDSLKSEIQELRNENCEIKKSLEFTQDQLARANKQLEDQAKCTGKVSQVSSDITGMSDRVRKLAVAIIICVYKAGDSQLLQNYRAISLLILVAFSKILEKLVYGRLIGHFFRNNFFTPAQFGFLPGKSTLDAAQKIVNDIYDSFDKGEKTVGVFLDLAKAYDTIDREKLCRKLEYYGVTGLTLQCFRSYLSMRRQAVRYKGVVSDLRTTKFGLPQGGILSCLLYIIYANDIVKYCPELNFVMYADDTNIYTCGRKIDEICNRLNAGLFRINEWLCSNGLTLNVDKSKYVVFRRQKSGGVGGTGSVYINDSNIERTDTVKFLGLMVDSGLKSKYVPILYSVRKNLAEDSLKMINNSIIHPHLTYCNSVWGACGKSKFQKLNSLVKKIVRVISFSPLLSHSPPLFVSLKLLNLQYINWYICVVFVYRALSRGSDWFHEAHISYSTRQSELNLLVQLNLFSHHSRQCVTWTGVEAWNALPLEIRRIDNIDTFKITTKK